MRNVHFASFMALTAAFAIGCGGGDSGTPDDNLNADSGTELDSSTGEVDNDTGVDTGLFELDSGTPDTGKPETAPDTSIVDTGTGTDTATADSGTSDTGPADSAMTCEAGTSCDTTNMCFTGKTLSSSCACTGGTAVSCDDSNACTTDSCDLSSGCLHVAAADGTSCGVGKKCVAGACSDLCSVGASCDDANACTTGEKFDATCACTGGTAIVCNDANPCTTDSCSPSTGCTATPLADGAVCGTGKTCKTGACIDPTLLLPTVKITSPTTGTVKGINAVSDICNPLRVDLTVNAPLKIKTLTWHLFTPTSTTKMNGGFCGAPATAMAPWRAGLGTPVYPFMIDPTKYGGLTTGTFGEDIAAAGLFGCVGGKPWLWCTTPGTGTTAFLTNLAGGAVLAPAGGLSSLAVYCHATTVVTSADATKQWTLIVQLTDQADQVAKDEIKFSIYKL